MPKLLSETMRPGYKTVDCVPPEEADTHARIPQEYAIHSLEVGTRTRTGRVTAPSCPPDPGREVQADCICIVYPCVPPVCVIEGGGANKRPWLFESTTTPVFNNI